MGPMIDQELEKTDSKHNELMSLNNKLTEAFQLYAQLMKDAVNVPQYPPAVGYMQQTAPLPTASYIPAQQTLPEQAMHTYSNPVQPPHTQVYCIFIM